MKRVFSFATALFLAFSSLSGQELLQPEHLVYQGNFRLPRLSGAARFGNGGHAIAVTESGSLLVAGHNHYDFVGEVTPPASLVSVDGSVVRAALVKTPYDISVGVYDQKLSTTLDTLGGLCVLPGGDVLSSWYRYYGVQPVSEIDDPTLHARTVDGEDRGLFHIGKKGEFPFNQKFTSGYLIPIPLSWRAANGIMDFSVACGRGDGAGNATSPKGPALFAMNPSISNPVGADIDAKALMYRVPGNEPPGWTPCDRWKGGAWIEEGIYTTVLFVGTKGTEPYWYGTGTATIDGQELADPWDQAKGHHCVNRRVEMQFFSPSVLSSVLVGDVDPQSVVPYRTIVLPQFHESSQVQGCAFDSISRRLYIVEKWPAVKDGTTYPSEDPLVHLWTVTVPTVPSDPVPGPIPPPLPIPPDDDTVSLEVIIGGVRYKIPLVKIE